MSLMPNPSWLLRATVLPLLLTIPFPEAVASGSTGNSPILVGQSIDLSGPEGDIAKDFVTGAQTYFDKINQEGGIGGRKIRLVVSNNKGSTAEMLATTKSFLEQQKVDLLFGYSGNGMIQEISGADFFRKSGTPMIAPYSGADTKNASGIYFIRPDNGSELLKLAEFYHKLGLKKFLLLYDGSDVSADRLAQIRSQFKTWGASLEERKIPNQMSSSQLEAEARSISQSRPDVILLDMNTIASAEFSKVYQTLDASVFMGATSRVNPNTYFDLLGLDRARNTLITQVVPQPKDLDIPVVKEHIQLMRQFRDEPPSHATLEGHIAAKLLVNALKHLPGGRITPAGIMSALQAVKKESLGGINLSFASPGGRGTNQVYLTYFNHRGRLLD